MLKFGLARTDKHSTSDLHHRKIHGFPVAQILYKIVIRQ